MIFWDNHSDVMPMRVRNRHKDHVKKSVILSAQLVYGQASREQNCIICLMNNGMRLQDTAAILMDTMALGLLLKGTYFR